MVKVNYASLETQSSTMSSASQSRVSGFNQLIRAFDNFANSGNDLTGSGYDAARIYATSVMIPYYKGCILYSEAVADAADALADSYVVKCGTENLDEDQLQAEINSVSLGCMSLSASISGLQSKSKPSKGDAERISSLQGQLVTAQSKLNEVQEKLENLRSFSEESPSACASADAYKNLISKVRTDISVSFGGGDFTLPEELYWVSVVEEDWAEREIVLEYNYLAALEKINAAESLTEADLTTIERYATEYPDRVDSSVIQYVREVRQVKVDEMKYRSLVDKLDSGKELTNEEIRTIEEKKESYPNVQVNTTTLNKIVAKRAYEKVQDKIKNNQTLTDKDKEIMSRYWRIYPGEERKEYNRLKKKVHSKEFFKIGEEGYTSEELLFIVNYLSNHPNETKNLDDDINYGIVMTEAYYRYHAHGDNPDYSPFNAGTGIYHDIIKKTGRYPNGEEADDFNKWFAKNDGMKYLTITQETLNLYHTIYGAIDMSKEAYKNGVSPTYTQNNGLLNYVDYLEINQSAKENPNEPEVDELLDSLEYLEH